MGKENQENLDTEEKKTKDKNEFFIFRFFRMGIKNIVTIAIVAVILALVLIKIFNKDEPVKEVITVSTLEKIIEVNELSTFKVVYNGVATADDKYHVSYEATVDAGIDFEKIEITVDNEAKKVNIKLPKAEILDTYVDIASMDYIFIDKKANTETVSQEAFKLCKYDVKHESENQEAIIRLAQQNAENVIRALVSPFVEQVDNEYEIVVQ